MTKLNARFLEQRKSSTIFSGLLSFVIFYVNVAITYIVRRNHIYHCFKEAFFIPLLLFSISSLMQQSLGHSYDANLHISLT